MLFLELPSSFEDNKFMGKQIIKLLFSIGLVVVALLVGMMAFVTDTDAKASLNWPAVTGVVKNTKIEKSGSRRVTFCPRVFYAYVINGKSYEGTLITEPEPFFSTEKEAQQITSRYPDNSQVQVYYNPKNPEQAHLIRGQTSQGQNTVWVSISFLIGSIAFFVVQLTRVLRRRW